jgi:hypothetical protein
VVAIIEGKEEAGGARYIEFKVYQSPTGCRSGSRELALSRKRKSNRREQADRDTRKSDGSRPTLRGSRVRT